MPPACAGAGAAVPGHEKLRRADIQGLLLVVAGVVLVLLGR